MHTSRRKKHSSPRGICDSYNGGGEVVCDLCEVGPENTACEMATEDGDEEGVVVSKSQGSCWTSRVRIGKAADEREHNASRVPALQASILYVDKKTGNLINPIIGTSFHSV